MVPTPRPTPFALPPMLRALRHHNYRLLFFGQLISLCGVWMQITAQAWLVLRLTDSPLWLGLIAAAQSLPVLLFSLPAGSDCAAAGAAGGTDDLDALGAAAGAAVVHRSDPGVACAG